MLPPRFSSFSSHLRKQKKVGSLHIRGPHSGRLHCRQVFLDGTRRSGGAFISWEFRCTGFTKRSRFHPGSGVQGSSLLIGAWAGAAGERLHALAGTDRWYMRYMGQSSTKHLPLGLVVGEVGLRSTGTWSSSRCPWPKVNLLLYEYIHAAHQVRLNARPLP